MRSEHELHDAEAIVQAAETDVHTSKPQQQAQQELHVVKQEAQAAKHDAEAEVQAAKIDVHASEPQ